MSLHKVRDRLHFHLYIYKLVLVPAHCTSFFFLSYFSLLNFSPAPYYLNAWNRICVTWLCPRVVARRLEIAPSSGRSLVERMKVVLKPLLLRFLNSSKSADEKLKCVKLPSSHKLLCYYLLCTIREFEVSSQWLKSYGVSTDIPTKYTKHCFLAIVLCEYWRNGYWININAIFAFILVCTEEKDLRITHSK